MDKSTANLAVGRHLAGRGELEALDDGRLTRSIGTDDESEWRGEEDGLSTGVVKRANAQDGQLFDERHDGQVMIVLLAGCECGLLLNVVGLGGCRTDQGAVVDGTLFCENVDFILTPTVLLRRHLKHVCGVSESWMV